MLKGTIDQRFDALGKVLERQLEADYDLGAPRA